MSSYKTGGSQYKTWFSSAQQETYLVSSIADRDALDKTVMAPGSSCYLDDGTMKWMLGSDMEWHEWPMGSGSGSGLPSVTTDDNGKVLGVVDGTWTSVENKPMPFRSIVKLDDYTYEVWYDNIDYNFAREYFEREPNINVGGCSAAFRNGKFIRNYDWKYDNTAQFIVHVAAAQGRHATIGVCGGIAELTPEFIDSGAYSDLYRVLPFYMQDGFNDAGLTCCMNVVPRDKGDNRYPVPAGQTEDVCGIMLVRYVLDNMNTVADMETKIPQVGMWFTDSLHGQGYELHYFAADIEQDSAVLEYVENEPVFHDIDRMTNFYIDGVTLNNDGTVYTPYTQDDTHNAMDTNGVTENGSGLERWNIITDAFNNETYTDIADLCPELYFTKAYTITEDANVWYTEFVGINGLTCATPYAEYADTVAAARAKYEERTREDEEPTWHTVHSTVYDLDNSTMHVIMQEGMSEYDDVKPVDAASLASTVVKTIAQNLTSAQQIRTRKNLGLYYDNTVTVFDWDGDTEGRPYFDVSPTVRLYKVSDYYFTEEPVRSHLEIINDAGNIVTIQILQFGGIGCLITVNGGMIYTFSKSVDFGGIVIPEPGTYVNKASEQLASLHNVKTLTYTDISKVPGNLVDIDLSQYATIDYVDTKIGEIESILETI